MSRHPKSWAVVGGGMMGMTVAYRLAQLGQRVTLYESAPMVGGLTSAWSIGDVTWDRFYHVVLLTDTKLRELLEELELEQEIRWVNTNTGFYADGKLYSMSNSLEFLTFPVLNLYQKFRLATTILLASRIKNWKRLESVTVEEWLRRMSGRSTFERIWLPLLRAKLGETYKKTSAAFIWAYIDRMYKARRTGFKQEMFGYVPGGYARILQRFTEVLKKHQVEIKVEHAVQQASYDEATAKNRLEFRNGSVDEFDNVVLTIPSTVLPRVCPQLSPAELQRHGGIEYLGVICASVLLNKSFQGYYVTNIIDAWVPLTGIIEMSTLVDATELKGHTLLYLPKYVEATDEAAFQESDESIRQRLLSTLERMYPDFSRNDVVAFKVARARHVMSLPTLNYSEQLPQMQTSVPGIFAINSAQIVEGNLNVNETLQIAEKAFSELIIPHVESQPGSPQHVGTRVGV